jgi:quercetin dioxygenase-like cupin family protein
VTLDVFGIDAARASAPPNPEDFVGRVRMQTFGAEGKGGGEAASLGTRRGRGDAEGVDNLGAAGGTTELDYLAVHFDAGAHTRPHTHATDQVLFFVQGSGFVWIAGEERQLVDQGGVVVVPAGVVHMHGATETEPICHLAARAPGPTDWHPPVPDEWHPFTQSG